MVVCSLVVELVLLLRMLEGWLLEAKVVIVSVAVVSDETWLHL